MGMIKFEEKREWSVKLSRLCLSTSCERRAPTLNCQLQYFFHPDSRLDRSLTTSAVLADTGPKQGESW